MLSASTLRQLALVILGIAASATVAEAQTIADTGRVLIRVVSRADTAQSYAVFIPPGYDASRRWPVMFLMDPRGRALIPLELFRDGARRHGWILVSSYNTASDGPLDPNQDAINAMLGDAQRDYSLDTRRFHLAGFSGTARVAWLFAYQLPGIVAGIVAVGGGLPTDPSWRLTHRGRPPFAIFGAAGIADFNYEEVRTLDASLDSLGATHHTEYFDGAHSWPPAALASSAIDWLELQAMRSGRRPAAPAWIDSVYAARIAEAESLAAARRDLAAHERFRQLAKDFDGLRDVADVRQRAATLGESETVRKARTEQARLSARDDEYRRVVGDFLRDARAKRDPVSVDRAMKQLRIESLRRDAANAADSLGAPAARRMLEQAFVLLSFYEPRSYIERGEPARALALLRLADAIRPGTPGVCLQRARAHSLLGDRKEAIVALQCVGDARALSAALLADPLFNALRDDPAFKELQSRSNSPP